MHVIPKCPQAQRCLRWDDPALGIAWPALGRPPLLAARDAAALQEMSALLSQHVAVAHGRDPVTGQRLPTPQRETQFVLCDGLLRCAGERLRSDLAQAATRLEAGRDQVGNALLAALQAGLLAQQARTPRSSLGKARSLWTGLCRADAQFALLDAKLRLRLHEADIALLVQDTLRRWPMPSRPSGAQRSPSP